MSCKHILKKMFLNKLSSCFYIQLNNFKYFYQIIIIIIIIIVIIITKSMKKKSKPGWEIRLETHIKKPTKTGKNDKTKEKRWNM